MSLRPKAWKSRRGSRSFDGDAGASSAGASSAGGLNPLIKWIVVGVAALVALAVAVALLAGRDAEQRARTDAAQVADVSIEGAPLPVFEDGESDPATGMAAPAFAATTFDGVEVSVLPGDGRAKVIGFFAHWCPHCQRELPRIADWLAVNRLPAGVEVIAVSTAVEAGRPNYPPSAWFEEERWPAVAVRDSDDNEIGDAYGLRGFPYTVAVGADGRIVARAAGELSDEAWGRLLDLVAPPS